MHIIIRLIGLMLLYQEAPGGPQRALLPRWESGDAFHERCEVRIMKHLAYIRVESDGVLDDKDWPRDRKCETGVDCFVYRIPDDTTLTIEPASKTKASQHEEMPCFVPNIAKENMVVNAKIHPDAIEEKSAVDYLLPAGHLSAGQFRNDQIYVTLHVPVDGAVAAENIRVIATPRAGSKAPRRELVLHPGTVVDVVSAPPEHITKSYHAVRPQHHRSEKEAQGHVFHLHKFLQDPQGCLPIPNTAPEPSCFAVRRNNRGVGLGTTLDIGCGPLYLQGGR